MKKFRFIIPLFLFGFALIATASCNKKKGNCYCKYASGDRLHFDLNELPRSEQEDSCKVIDNNASAFGGDCKLK